jgi:tRNA (Thr-GGU) A37 N-methylase
MAFPEGHFRCAPRCGLTPSGHPFVLLVAIKKAAVLVRGLDCVDGTPLLDLKPDRTLFTPIAPAQAGDF